MGLAELQNADGKLTSFLNARIAISTTTRERAANSQNYLRTVLANKENCDPIFPCLLNVEDSDFIGGSFGRHTKIWPLDDIDLFIPMDGCNLMYTESGIRQPFTVVTDGNIHFNRLSGNTFVTDGYIKSDKVLDYFLKSLQETYAMSSISVDKHCVNIQTTIEATSQSDGIGFDVVPCLRLTPYDDTRGFYFVPDGTGGWMRSDPRFDNELCAALHKHHQKHFRKIVRLIKYWNQNKLGGAIGSYYIELALMRFFEEIRQQGRLTTHIIGALALGFDALKNAYDNGDLTPFTAGAPMVTKPPLTTNQVTSLAIGVGLARNAYTFAESDSDLDRTNIALNMLFGTKDFS